MRAFTALLSIILTFVETNLCFDETIYCNPTYCNKSSVSEDFTSECHNYSGLVKDKCCYLNNTIIGYDLSRCDIKSFHSDKNMKSLEILFLDQNNLNVTDDDFRGLTKLNYLRLPLNIECPGASYSWRFYGHTDNYTLCVNQTHTCSQPCPPNSHCEEDGPGCQQCLCNATFFGYKCLKQGHFPTFVYLMSWIGSTIVACFLLFFYRRHQFKERLHTLPNLYQNINDQSNSEEESAGPSMTHFASGRHRNSD